MTNYYFYYNTTGTPHHNRQILLVKDVNDFHQAHLIAQSQYQSDKSAYGGLITIAENNSLIQCYPITELCMSL